MSAGSDADAGMIPSKDRSAVSSAYDRWSATYDTDENRTRDLDAIALRNSVLPLSGADVLELGCGTGKNTEWLAEQAATVLALDASPGMLAIAKQRITARNVRLVEHDIQVRWPVPDESTDVVVADLVLEHVEHVNVVFSEAARVLRKNGALFICELHPARQLLGGRAHFVDSERMVTVNVPVFRHTVSELINGGIEVGLIVGGVVEWSDPETADEESPARPPRLFSATFRKR